MEREYRTITTPVSKQIVVLKAWITGREEREMRSHLLENVNFSATSKDGEVNNIPDYKFSAKSLEDIKDKTISTIVVSVNDSKDNVLNTVLDMRLEDYNFVISEINKITNPITEEEKKS